MINKGRTTTSGSTDFSGLIKTKSYIYIDIQYLYIYLYIYTCGVYVQSYLKTNETNKYTILQLL